MEWNSDMSTAPMDGTVVLIFVPKAKRKIKLGQWISKESSWVVYGWKDMNGCFHSPTHWMPLPEPPVTE